MKKITAIILALVMLVAFLAVPFGAADSEVITTRSAEDYYLVGTMTDWQISRDYHLTEVETGGYELYVIRNVYLTTNDMFKFAYSSQGSISEEWFPYGIGNNFNENEQGIFDDTEYDIYFRPNMDGGDGWFYGCIMLERSDGMDATEPVPGAPPGDEPGMPAGGSSGFYLYGTFSDWQLKDEYELVLSSDGLYETKDYVALTATDMLCVVYSQDKVFIEAEFPQYYEKFFMPAYNSRYYKIEFDPSCSQSGGDWFEGCIKASIAAPPEMQLRSGIDTPVYDYKLGEFMEFDFQEDYSYSELYYHTSLSEVDPNGAHFTDWVLVSAAPNVPNEGAMYGVFDEVVLMNGISYPFNFGYGVYDCYSDKFYSITQAWNMGFDDLHDVFVHVLKSKDHMSSVYYLGDADLDGELTILDATHLQRFTVRAEDLEYDENVTAHKSHYFGPKIKYLSDFNCDGERDIVDVTFIQRQVTGIELYKHAPTASVEIVEKDGKYYAKASSSFMRGNVKYRYWITGTLHGGSYFDESNMGAFSFCSDPDYGSEPGRVILSTDSIDDDCVELPLDAVTKDEMFTLTVTAKDSSGRLSSSERYNFFNTSVK